MTFRGKRVLAECVQCGRTHEASLITFRCPSCGGLLDIVVEPHAAPWSSLKGSVKGVWRYASLLPVPDDIEPVSLGEGWTPLIRAERLEKLLGLRRVYVKFEGCNPTGSFKDRGMTVAVSLAVRLGVRRFVVASTGNTSASAAAYSASAGRECYVLLPAGGVARGKLAQAVLHGAKVIEVAGSFDDALEVVMKLAERRPDPYPLNSFNPWRLEGQKTAGYEVVEQLGKVPDWVVVPVGNAGNISAIGKAFLELRELGVTKDVPRLVGVQASGAAPLAKAWASGRKRLEPVRSPATVASAIRIGHPVNWLKAWKVVESSGGTFVAVDDDDILRAQVELARLAGVGAEPAGAASLAALRKLREEGVVDPGDEVVLVVTGHALKDPDTASVVPYQTISARSPGEVSRLLSGGS